MSTFNYYSVTKKIFINIYCIGIAHLWSKIPLLGRELPDWRQGWKGDLILFIGIFCTFRIYAHILSIKNKFLSWKEIGGTH